LLYSLNCFCLLIARKFRRLFPLIYDLHILKINWEICQNKVIWFVFLDLLWVSTCTIGFLGSHCITLLLHGRLGNIITTEGRYGQLCVDFYCCVYDPTQRYSLLSFQFACGSCPLYFRWGSFVTKLTDWFRQSSCYNYRRVFLL
jgi:hypothetical protein